MIWLRYVVLAVCVLSLIQGYRKGLVKTVVSMVFLILVTFLSGFLNPYVSQALEEHTPLDTLVYENCMEAFSSGVSEEQIGQRGADWLIEMGVPPVIAGNMMSQVGAGTIGQSMTEYVASAVTKNVIRVVAYSVSFVLAMVFVILVTRIVELVAELPGISLLNRLGGAAVGLIRALILVWIFLAALYFLGGTEWGRSCMEQVRGDEILRWLYEQNPIIQIWNRIVRAG